MPSKISIKIPAHNSLTPTRLDDLLRIVATSRKAIDARKVRYRLPEKYHIAIVSTGLSYLQYLGALKKIKRGYKATSSGKNIGTLLKLKSERADAAWSELLKRHIIYQLFYEYFALESNKPKTVEGFGLFLKDKAGKKWNESFLKNRVVRLCELYADKGLIKHKNDEISPFEESLQAVAGEKTQPYGQHTLAEQIPSLAINQPSSISASSMGGPLKVEVKIEISDKVAPEVMAMILSFLKGMEKISVERSEESVQ